MVICSAISAALSIIELINKPMYLIFHLLMVRRDIMENNNEYFDKYWNKPIEIANQSITNIDRYSGHFFG